MDSTFPWVALLKTTTSSRILFIIFCRLAFSMFSKIILLTGCLLNLFFVGSRNADSRIPMVRKPTIPNKYATGPNLSTNPRFICLPNHSPCWKDSGFVNLESPFYLKKKTPWTFHPTKHLLRIFLYTNPLKKGRSVSCLPTFSYSFFQQQKKQHNTAQVSSHFHGHQNRDQRCQQWEPQPNDTTTPEQW